MNGFIILDLHNLYCQIRNFSIGFDELITLYPLDRVREIHISGGSWEDSLIDPGRKIRRDTHDDAVPSDVFDLLSVTLEKCPHLKYVVLEQLGTGLRTDESKETFYRDFEKMEGIVRRKNKSYSLDRGNSFLPLFPVSPGNIIEDEVLYDQQLQLSAILEDSVSYEEALDSLRKSSLAQSDWGIENWEPAMVETAMRIAQKWRK